MSSQLELEAACDYLPGVQGRLARWKIRVAYSIRATHSGTANVNELNPEVQGVPKAF